jgi:hypothetical protein
MEQVQEQISIMDKVLAILQGTNDGSKLAPKHLWLVQEAVNNGMDCFSDYGVEQFNQLYDQVVNHTYDAAKVWFYGIEHMTKDQTGYVYWKGKHIEHFSFGRDTEGEKAAAHKLAGYCREIEKEGNTPCMSELFKIWDLRDAENEVLDAGGAFAD